MHLAKLTIPPQVPQDEMPVTERRPYPADAVLRFLRSGIPILAARTLRDDAVDPARRRCVPLTFSTDGEWIWPGELAYYLKVHGIWPEEEFLAYMRAHHYTPTKASKEQVNRALSFLRDPAAVSVGHD